ncbi:uncharacterized protein LOC126567546 [Anopheles maculipalpis]|uniref:uncharacterized protein LOC126567546 n=1 Tax=Anopheles maculipalpis TaxID=1496333 RepID=UPI002159191E|nr:uncharacterized protein LOC126567546 [Anopheles maculipalpis]
MVSELEPIPITSGTIVGAPFGGYAPFGHPPSAVLPPPRHAAFYPQPILYWGYPSPPVSPTTYYSTAPPPGAPHHLGPAAHQTAPPGMPTHSHAQPTMLALSPDQRNQPQHQRNANNPSVSLVTTLPPRSSVGTAGSSSGESSTSQSSSPPLLSPTGGCSSSGSVTSSSSGTSQRHHGGTSTIRTSSSPPQPTSASLLSLPLAAGSSSQPLAIPTVTTPTGGLAGAYPGSQLSPIIPPPSVHFPPHHAPLMGTASPPGTTGTTFYESPLPHLPHHPTHHHPHHHHHHPHPLTHHHHDKLVATAPSILTPSLIPNQYVELFIV